MRDKIMHFETAAHVAQARLDEATQMAYASVASAQSEEQRIALQAQTRENTLISEVIAA